MPQYCYKCACGKTDTDVRSIAKRNDPTPCACGQLMQRDPTAEGCHSSNMEYARPIYSEAMGVHPDQVQEHRRAHPNIEMTDTGEVVIRSHAEHKRVMKELGFFNRA